MFHSLSRLFLAVFLLLFYFPNVIAQETAPYSRFALGEVLSPALAPAKAMGGISAAYNDPLQINFVNPASYSSLSLTTMETGLNFITKRINDGATGTVYKTGDGFIDYFSLAFPASKKLGVSFGLIPYSRMGYNFEGTIDALGADDSVKLFEGNGRTYQLYFGAGYEIMGSDTSKNSLSVGLNLVYLFGNLEQSEAVRFGSRFQGFHTRVNSITRITNVALNVGFQYKRKIRNDTRQSKTLIVGNFNNLAVLGSSEQEVKWDKITYNPSLPLRDQISVDVVYEDIFDRNEIKIPTQIGFGVSLEKMDNIKSSRLIVGLDFIYTLWANFEKINKDLKTQNSWKFAFGGEYRPNYLSNNFFKRAHYRFGTYYENGYLNVKNTVISEYGITFGLGIAIKSIFSRLNFSFDFGVRGTQANGLIKETYYRSYIGLTFNDKWFIKRKYD